MCEDKFIPIGNGWAAVELCNYLDFGWTIWKKELFVCSVGEIYHDG